MVKIYYQFQVREIVDAMEERNVPKGSYVIREGKLFLHTKATLEVLTKICRFTLILIILI